MRISALLLAAFLPSFAASVMLAAADAPRLTGPEPFTKETPAPPLPREVTDDVRKRRNYPDQPPLIPHSIQGYQIDLNANKCLTCHSRKFTEQSQAPMISVTHYQDRDGNFLAGVAPRRYACLSCHVPQTMAAPLIENQFIDADALVEPEQRPLRGQ